MRAADRSLDIIAFVSDHFREIIRRRLSEVAGLCLITLALLGWRLMTHKPVGDKWRSLLWIVATFLAAAFASTLPRIGSWPLPTGLGGVAGDAVLRLPAMVFGSPLAGVTRLVLCMVLGLATAMTLALATGVRQRMEKRAARVVEEENVTEEDDLDHDHGSAWIGMVVHALLSWKARIGRMIRGDTGAHALTLATRTARQEPSFDGRGRVLYETELENGDE